MMMTRTIPLQSHPFYQPRSPLTLIMEDEHLDTIPSVENLIPIPSEFKGISEDTCDVPICEDPSTFDALSNHSEILSDSNNDGTSSDDDSYENIKYVEASPLNLEYDSLEEVNEDQEEKEFDLEDIFQIQDVILREKLVKISRLITNIESLKDNPTPECVLKFSHFLFPLWIVIRSLRSPILLSLIQITLYLNSRLLAIIRKRREVAVPLLMLITLFPSMIRFFLRLSPIREELDSAYERFQHILSMLELHDAT
ncbi:hypothetical protein Tco_0035638, partial [Tanacetum coccineum]